MYFEYTLEADGHILTDGKSVLSNIKLKSESLMKYMQLIKFQSGKTIALKSDKAWKAKNYQILDEHSEPIGMVRSVDGSPTYWLEIYDKLILKNKYSFKAQKEKFNYSIAIGNESGETIALIERKFIPKKLKICFIVVERNHDNLIFEDRNFIYTLAFATKNLLKN
jgi:hypothetical protein